MLGLKIDLRVLGFLKALIPLNVNIATIMSILLLAVAGGIVINDQIVGRQAALTETRATFQGIGEAVRLELQALHGPVETAVEAMTAAVALVPPAKMFTLDTVRLFANRVSETEKLYALFYADRNGNFILVFNLSIVAPGAGPAYLSWIIERPKEDDFRQTVVMLDKEFGVLSTDTRQYNGYDPRIRPWFHAAMQSVGAIQTPPYIFFETNDIGITVAKRTKNSDGVVGGHLTLQTVSKALSGRRTSATATASRSTSPPIWTRPTPSSPSRKTDPRMSDRLTKTMAGAGEMPQDQPRWIMLKHRRGQRRHQGDD